MPMTRSEAMFFTAGLVIGATAGANYPPSRRSSVLSCLERSPGTARRSANRIPKWPRRWPRKWKPCRTRWLR